MKIKAQEAQRFIKTLTGEKDPVLCFQPIADKGSKKYQNFHAAFSSALPRLESLQKENAGVFITLNETDGRGRKKENIKSIRALFIDCDDWQGETPLNFSIEAGRPGRRHFFFLSESEIALATFSRYQKMLAEIYQSDKSVSDLPRVVRLPGTWNLKGKPELHSLIDCRADRFKIEEIVSDKIYSFASFINAEAKPEPGGRNHALFKLAAKGVNLDIEESDRLQILHNYNLKNIDPPLDFNELKNINSNAGEYAKEGIENDFAEPVNGGDSIIEDLQQDLDYWRSWAYVAATNSFFDLLSMEDYSVEQFNNMHLDRIQARNKPAAAVLQSNQVEKFETIVYEPGKELKLPGVRLKKLNLYKPPDLKPAKGNLDWFNNHLEYLIPETRERNLFIDWIAYSVKYPGRKIHFALVLQGLQGIGKSYFKHLFRQMIGDTNVIEPHGDNLKSRFNGFLKKGQLIVIEELMLSGGEGASAINRLKQWITEDRLMIEDKGRNVVLMENKFNLFCLTNFRDALRIDEHDRRFFIVFSPAKPKPANYYKTLFSGIEGKASALAYYLINEHKFSKEFEAQGRAPATHAKNLMIESSRSTVEAWLKERIENKEPPFASDLISINEIVENDWLPESLRKNQRIANDLGRYLRRAGAEQLGRLRVNHKQVRFWAVRNQTKWRDAEPGELAEYLAEQAAGQEVDFS